MSGTKSKIGWFFCILCIVTYVSMLITFLVFLTTMLLLGLIIVIPLLMLAFIRKDKELIIRRFKASSWALGLIILFLFPAFWGIPQQMNVRVNRQTSVITPNAPKVVEFAAEFRTAYPNYDTYNFTTKALSVSKFTTTKIAWKQDYENYLMVGHVATPTECITLRSDDCQGQAVTMASLLLNLGFQYVWVVETPFHWYVLVRDPALGALPAGWEASVEEYQASGAVMALNRDGGGGMPSWRLEEIVLIFNDKETLYPVNPIQATIIGWTATGFYVHELFPFLQSPSILYLFIGMFILAVPFAFWGYYMSPLDKERRKADRKGAGKRLLKRIIIIGPALSMVFVGWLLLQNIIWDYTLILAFSEMSLIAVLASEPKFWKTIRMERD